jgi:hypothetical protein
VSQTAIPVRYFKRKWEESRGDEYDSWGPSTWYFEVGDDGYPVRQLELYDGGAILKYDVTLQDDQFGGLGDQPLDLDEFAPYEIERAAFENAWSSTSGRNGPR